MLQSILKIFTLLTMPFVVLSSNTVFSMKRQNPYAHQNMQTSRRSAFHAYNPSKQQHYQESFISQTDSETEDEEEANFFSTPLQSDYSSNIETLACAAAQLISMAIYNPDIETFSLQITKSPTKRKQSKPTKYQRTKNFPCPFEGCDKSFTSSSNLTNHERTHSGEKPFACQFCPKSFAAKGNLATHERRHTGERPFPCRYCNERFCASNDRNKHEKTHTGQDYFVCGTCGKLFTQTSNLNKHIKAKHA